MAPLDRLRRNLAYWYVGTLAVMLALLGTGLLLTIRHQFSVELSRSLASAVGQLETAARVREMEGTSHARVVDAVDELHIPDRALYLMTRDGTPVRPPTAPLWVQNAARAAAASGQVLIDWEPTEDRDYRLRAERFTTPGGASYIAVAVASRVELEDRYAWLIATFGGAAVVALLLVSGAGWFLVGKSIAPIERSIAHMRRFMADAAHELRTPAAVIRSAAEVALQQERNAEAYAESLRVIEAESGRLGDIVDDLLMLARADAGEQTIARQRVFLDDIVSDAVSAAHVLARRKNVVVTMRDFQETIVMGDAVLLRQLVMIVLDNAVKFTPPDGQVAVIVRTAGTGPGIVVEDTGIGIPADQLPHVFERFFRGDSARARSGDPGTGTPGTGLGLSIARWIADVHHATIDITSTVGVGTRVAITFPVPAPDHGSPAPSRSLGDVMSSS